MRLWSRWLSSRCSTKCVTAKGWGTANEIVPLQEREMVRIGWEEILCLPDKPQFRIKLNSHTTLHFFIALDLLWVVSIASPSLCFCFHLKIFNKFHFFLIVFWFHNTVKQAESEVSCTSHAITYAVTYLFIHQDVMTLVILLAVSPSAPIKICN